MKSEIEEFWSLLNSEDLQEQKIAFQRWKEFAIRHPQYFNEIKPYMSKSFCTIYEKMNLHDFQIVEIICNTRQYEKTEITFLLYNYYEDYGKDFYLKLKYKNVSEYFFNVKSTDYHMSWTRDIFEIIENNKLKHRIMCSDGISMEIVSKKVSLVKVKV